MDIIIALNDGFSGFDILLQIQGLLGAGALQVDGHGPVFTSGGIVIGGHPAFGGAVQAEAFIEFTAHGACRGTVGGFTVLGKLGGKVDQVAGQGIRQLTGIDFAGDGVGFRQEAFNDGLVVFRGRTVGERQFFASQLNGVFGKGQDAGGGITPVVGLREELLMGVVKCFPSMESI